MKVAKLQQASGTKVSVVGGTGLVGTALLRQLIVDPHYREVHSLSRRLSPLSDAKLKQILIDFEDREALDQGVSGETIFLCLGTTIKTAGSREAQFRVDHDYQLWAADAARKAGATTCVVVSSMGANPGAMMFYPRMKGQLELGLRDLGFSRLVILRPGLLDGSRQENRPAERLALGILRRVPRAIMPTSAWPVSVEIVASAMRTAARTVVEGTYIWEAKEIFARGAVDPSSIGT